MEKSLEYLKFGVLKVEEDFITLSTLGTLGTPNLNNKRYYSFPLDGITREVLLIPFM
jgi:hypothetical protein